MSIIKTSAALLYRLQLVYFLIAASLPSLAQAGERALARASLTELSQRLQVGDIVFVRIDFLPFKRIASDTGSWTNHVGIITAIDDGMPMVSESTFPFSHTTSLEHFISRSEHGRTAVSRLIAPLTSEQQARLNEAAGKRNGILYDTGFDLHSKRQFCSRYVHEVVAEATGVALGKNETLSQLFRQNPEAHITFWRFWYFGNIPWERETITPASVLASPHLHHIFDGHVDKG